ncbi:MAG TPA: adenylate kinase [Gemmatimonadaceae bacterium]|nr:adenylate kinase [Gemmatimonadaceae bacterium]
MNILLFGKPGAGKGTQAPMLAETLGVPTLATGDVLRNATREGTPLGRKAKEYMDRGDLVPDDVILGIVGEALAQPQYTNGAILDGVVRTVPQAEGLERVLKQMGRKLDAVVSFDIDNDEIVRRLSGRTVCANCQTPYMGREPGDTCEKCGGTLMRRRDDEPAAIRNRLSVYEAQTAPVFDWYTRNSTRMVTVDAVGAVADVTKRALKGLGR